MGKWGESNHTEMKLLLMLPLVYSREKLPAWVSAGTPASSEVSGQTKRELWASEIGAKGLKSWEDTLVRLTKW